MGTFLFTDQFSYQHSLALVGYTSVILVLGSLFNAGIVYLRGIDMVTDPQDLLTSGLNIFFRMQSIGQPLYVLLSEISVFSVWSLILIVVGLEKMASLSRGKAITVTLLVWSLAMGFKVGIARMAGQFMG